MVAELPIGSIAPKAQHTLFEEVNWHVYTLTRTTTFNTTRQPIRSEISLLTIHFFTLSTGLNVNNHIINHQDIDLRVMFPSGCQVDPAISFPEKLK